MKVGVSNQAEYRNRLLYLSNRASGDIFLRINDHYYPAALTVLETSGGILPYVDLLITFDVDLNSMVSTDDAVAVMFADRAFGNGILKIQIDPRSLRCTQS